MNKLVLEHSEKRKRTTGSYLNIKNAGLNRTYYQVGKEKTLKY
jgi:hypothetical protein